MTREGCRRIFRRQLDLGVLVRRDPCDGLELLPGGAGMLMASGGDEDAALLASSGR